jgi:6-pyruvoyltetrahydropterin/6-carboxytetrahydropterin synthase
MFEVMVEKHFASAHHLLNYKGKCENPHGHNYVIQVYAQKETLDKANVSFDFTNLKKELQKVVDDLDHIDLNTFPAFNGESPSAEFIARYAYHRLKPLIAELTKVTLYETPTQYASYFE